MDKVLLSVSQWSRPLTVPAGLLLKDFQIEPTLFALSRNRSYLALDPGLGKSIIASVMAATLKGWNTLYICPPFLVLNTVEELQKWAPGRRVGYVMADTDLHSNLSLLFKYDVLVLPDSIITRPEVKNLIMHHVVQTVETFLVVDEAHRYKNKKAKRTAAIFGVNKGREITRHGIVGMFDKTVLLSGTPMPNRPIELYHLLIKMAGECIDFMTEFDFGMKYCKGFRTAFGWDFTGHSNMAELSRRVKHPTGPFMYRLRKDKLGLPPKTEEILVVGRDMSPELAALNKQMLKHYSPEDVMRGVLAKKAGLEFEGELHVATYRKLLAQEKVAPVADYVRDFLETTDESIIVFGIHKEAIAQLEKKLYTFSPITITGKTDKRKRHQMVKDFQAGKRRLFIGNITAAGIGLTLTRACRVVFLEDDWVPGMNDQATDRTHRIGQDKPVHSVHCVFRNSFDKQVMEANIKKREAIAHI